MDKGRGSVKKEKAIGKKVEDRKKRPEKGKR
jgi:hypothetical protein